MICEIKKLSSSDPMIRSCATLEFECLKSMAWSTGQIEESIIKSTNFGYLYIASDKNALAVLSYYLQDDRADVVNLAVDNGARRLRLATRLMDALSNICLTCGAKVISLEYAYDNEAAAKFYEKYGFCKVGIRKSFYATPEGSRADAILCDYAVK